MSANHNAFKTGSTGRLLYASFGVLDFKPGKSAKPLSKVKTVKLTLVQSLMRFSKDGAVKIYVSTDLKTGLERDSSPLKFDVKSPGGLGDQLKTLHPLGQAKFTKKATREADNCHRCTRALTPSETGATTCKHSPCIGNTLGLSHSCLRSLVATRLRTEPSHSSARACRS